MRRKHNRRSFKGQTRGERAHACNFGRVPVHPPHDHAGKVSSRSTPMLPRYIEDRGRRSRIDSMRRNRSWQTLRVMAG